MGVGLELGAAVIRMNDCAGGTSVAAGVHAVKNIARLAVVTMVFVVFIDGGNKLPDLMDSVSVQGMGLVRRFV